MEGPQGNTVTADIALPLPPPPRGRPAGRLASLPPSYDACMAWAPAGGSPPPQPSQVLIQYLVRMYLQDAASLCACSVKISSMQLLT